MAKELTGKRIAIGASRNTDEMSKLIEKQGGEPIVRSLQGTVFLSEDEIEAELMKLIREGTDWIIFTTGIGVQTLLETARKIGVLEQFKNIIQHSLIATRGYKTYSMLKKLGIIPMVKDKDGTTKSLLESLDSFNFKGKKVTVQLHGETAPSLIKYLEEKGATVSIILPYRHVPPHTGTVEALCQEIFNDQLDAVCFTTAIQVRSLFDYARKEGYLNTLVTSFHTNTVAVAVGRVTAEALREEGIEKIIIPEVERMGAMVIKLSHYYRNKEEIVQI
jgi:uroporphyrinogen-III synthase